MKHAILIIGDDLLANKGYLDYIFDNYCEHFGELGPVKFQNQSGELLFAIEPLAKEFDSVCVFCSDENFATMSKILATHTGDTLVLDDEKNIIPKKSLVSKQNSFLIKLGSAYVNLINASPTKKMGEILLPNDDEIVYFTLFDIDKEGVKILLNTIAKPYKISITMSEILPNWIIIRAKKDLQISQMGQFLQSVNNLFSQKMIPGHDPLKFIAQTLSDAGLKITFAESCTAGLCSAKLARYSGISSAFDGSLVTYANRIKNEWLNVSTEILQNSGAVSEECVQEMLKGALQASDADFCLAISGIAGPDGGSDEKPVGCVFVGAMGKDGREIILRLQLDGDRNFIREQSVMGAFACLLRLYPHIFFKEDA
ncbi:MAG: CinA family protein [Campylobacter sp.]|nr:CinA family protein [Campylobacter sp.]